MNAVSSQCDTFLSTFLKANPSSPLLNCIYMYNLQLSPEDILKNIKSKLDCIFCESLEKYVFLNFEFSDLYAFILNKEFNVDREYILVKAIVLWLDNDIGSTLHYAEQLFELINCKLCYKKDILQNKIINTSSPELDEIIKQLHIKIAILNDNKISEVIKLYNIDNINSIIVPKYIPIHRLRNKCLFNVTNEKLWNLGTDEVLFRYSRMEVNRVIYTSNELLFIISFTDCKMYKFDIATNSVYTCSYPLDYPLETAPSVNEISGDRLITIGGCKEGPSSDEVMYYDILKDSWSKGLNLPYGICRHATVVDGDDIYVIGGLQGCYEINTVIRYSNGVWSTLSPLLKTRKWHTALLDDKFIYVYGGLYKYDCECYNIITGEWSVINTDVFENIISCYSDIDEDNHLLYSSDFEGNVCSISLDTYTMSTLYNNIPQSHLVLMNV